MGGERCVPWGCGELQWGVGELAAERGSLGHMGSGPAEGGLEGGGLCRGSTEL